ncbi:MAG TPA: hypothetical protein VGF45_09240 [Polyangia bacterium]
MTRGPRYRLDYRPVAGEGCPSTFELRRMVEEHLGHSPFDERATGQIVCEIVKLGDELRGLVLTRDARDQEGLREIVSPQASCREIASAASLAIAIAINPGLADPTATRIATTKVPGRVPARRERSNGAAALAEKAPETAIEPGVAPQGEDDNRQSNVERPEPEAPEPAKINASVEENQAGGRTTSVFVGLGTSMMRGYQPRVGLGADLLLAFRRGSLTGGFEALVNQPTSLAFQGGEVSGQVWGAVAFGCTGRGLISVCGSLTSGVLRGKGRNLPQADEGATGILTLGPRILLQHEFAGGWWVLLHTTVSASLLRTTLWVGESAVWKSPIVSSHMAVLIAHSF